MGPVVGCTHQVQHMHGTHRGYACGCRCDDCRRAYRHYAKRRAQHTLIPAAAVHRHIEDLHAAGMSYEQIGFAAGLSSGGAKQVLEASGTQRRIAARILAVQVGVTAVGVRRRLQALAAIGWTRPEISAAVGTTENSVTEAMRTQRAYVSGSLASRVTAAYGTMWRGPERPSRRALTAARRAGYAPPLAWDDDTIDDQRVQPQGLGFEGRVTVSDMLDEALRQAELGRSWDETCARLDTTTGALERRFRRWGHWVLVAAAFGISRRAAA